MPLWDDIARSISEAIGTPFVINERAAIGGGDINAAWRINDIQGTFFVKTNTPDRIAMFEAEAAGLRELADADAIRVPQPICDGKNAEASWLVLEYIAFGQRENGAALGSGLAALHRITAQQFGWTRDNTIGATPQINTRCDDWLTFWRAYRLGFQLDLAKRKAAPRRLLDRGERLLADCEVLFANYRPQPALLHGDLWGGNAGTDALGAPVIFDPAVYYGDRETDLAMTELFGGFTSDFYAAYKAALPLDTGYPVRCIFYNLYHILNHFHLFGGGYARQAEQMVEQVLAEI
jgi:fructosamine-3-kinase